MYECAGDGCFGMGPGFSAAADSRITKSHGISRDETKEHFLPERGVPQMTLIFAEFSLREKGCPQILAFFLHAHDLS